MQKIFSTKNCCFIILYTFLVLTTSDVVVALQKVDNWPNKLISINFQNEPLSMVLKEISKQAGVSIAYDKNLKNKKVTGNYKKITISDALARLLKDKNNSILINEEKRTLLVKTFGSKDFIWTNIGDNDARVMGTDITITELDTLNIKQLEQNQQTIGEDSLIMGSNLRLSDLNKLHLNPPPIHSSSKRNVTILGSDITIQEIDELARNIHKKSLTDKNKNNTFIMGSDMTMAKLDYLHSNQNRSPKTSTTDKRNNYILGSNMTIAELDNLHSKHQLSKNL